MCRSINRAAYDWAWRRASERARARFMQFGQQLTFEEALAQANLALIRMHTIAYSH